MLAKIERGRVSAYHRTSAPRSFGLYGTFQSLWAPVWRLLSLLLGFPSLSPVTAYFVAVSSSRRLGVFVHSHRVGPPHCLDARQVFEGLVRRHFCGLGAPFS